MIWKVSIRSARGRAARRSSAHRCCRSASGLRRRQGPASCLLDDVFGSVHGGSRVLLDHLADDQPVVQHAERSEMLLDRRRLIVAGQNLDIGRKRGPRYDAIGQARHPRQPLNAPASCNKNHIYRIDITKETASYLTSFMSRYPQTRSAVGFDEDCCFEATNAPMGF